MKFTICLIDDDETMLSLLEYYFEADYNVVAFTEAKRALSWVKETNDCDLIISDIRMPEMTGIDFLVIVKDNILLQNIPVFILSSVDKNEERINCLRNGAEDYIVKPFNPKSLSLKIEELFYQGKVSI